MSIDLSGMSVAELNDLGKRITKEVRVREAQEKRESERLAAEKRKDLYHQMRELAAKAGMSVEDVVANAPIRGRRKRSAMITGPKSPPKYRNPENPDQTWTGKGRKPGWLVAALDSGKNIKELEIQ
jgi:DNA-binding protein H-NS